MALRGEWSAFRHLVFLLRRIRVRPIHLIVPLGLSMGAAFFEGAGMGLLIPLLNGFLSKDFSFLKDIPVLGTALTRLPPLLVGSDRALFATLLGLFVVVILLKNVLRYLTSIAVSYFSVRFLFHLRRQMFARYLSFGRLFFDRTSAGHHANVLYESSFLGIQPLMEMDRYMNALFSLVSYLAIMAAISWKLTLFALPIFALLYFSVRKLVDKLGKLSQDLAAKRGELNQKIMEIFSTIPLVRAFAAEDLEKKRFALIGEEKARIDMSMSVVQNAVGPFQEMITLFAALLLFSTMLYLLVRGGAGTPPAFIVYFYMVINVSNRFGTLSSIRTSLANASGPLDSVIAVFEDGDKHVIPSGDKECTGLHEAIRFRDLRFSYTGDRDVLRGLDLTIERGKMTAIVGPTGAGKSTIIHLLMRFYDCPPGTLFLDGTDIRAFRTDSLLRHLALVSQETYLFHDTLRNNIAYAMDDVSEERLREAVRQARLEDVVSRLPKGLETLVGDRGMKLSGGERQRVSIARALLKGADILILDEATSSLDSRTEKLIQEAIDDVIRDKTAIVIAHRLSTIRHADKIAVIEDGRCTEEGALADLLAKDGTFRMLWEEQKFT
ncbi:MAG: ABC transporter ATP-binding protein [Candidatus Peribacteraceae bacterium]|nr:ABC transporter ATP-binding protein [Candidatus Peribacteraceae bacterium]